MAATATYTLSTTRTAIVTQALSTGSRENVNLSYPTTNKPIKKYGHDVYTIAASGSGDIWPDAVGTIAAGDAIHFEIHFFYGSTDTTQANKAVTVTVNAEVIKGWGQPLMFEESSATTVVVARSAGAEDLIVEVFWYVYTV